MNRLLALGLALVLAAPAAALPAPSVAPPSGAEAPPADDARCNTCDAIDLMLQGNFWRGRHILEMRAAAGDVSAITGFGLMHQNGWGVPVDYDQAMNLYQNAARKGDRLAMNQIGYLFLRGLGRTADPKAAWCWFERAAERGFDKSAHHLAEMMAAGMQPVSCTPSGGTTSIAAERRQVEAAAPATGLELWNGVREGMTPVQAASVLPAAYRWANPPAAPIGDHPISDGVIAPAALFGHPAIAQVLFAGHAAKIVNLVIDPPSDDPEQNLNLARALVERFDATYGRSFQVTDQGGDLGAIWTRGDLTIDLEYMPLPDQPATFMVVFKRKNPAERVARPSASELPAPGIGGT